MATMDNAYQDATQSGVDLVVGLGASGYSCVRFLARQGRDLRVVDSRFEPPFASQLRDTLPDVDVEFGQFDDLPLDDVDRINIGDRGWSPCARRRSDVRVRPRSLRDDAQRLRDW